MLRVYAVCLLVGLSLAQTTPNGYGTTKLAYLLILNNQFSLQLSTNWR